MAGNTAPKSAIQVPHKLYLRKVHGKNHISQVKYPASLLENRPAPGDTIVKEGKRIFISGKRSIKVPDGADDVLCLLEGEEPQWAEEIERRDEKWDSIAIRRAQVTADLKGKLALIEEERTATHVVARKGLRPPQIGAVYAVLGHWKASPYDVATVVMPTGTGKTDSMIALMAFVQPSCLLVVVPTDALRTQLADKFATFGFLKEFGLLPNDVPYPIVGVLKTGLENPATIRTFCQSCNVIVTTMSLLATFSDLHQKALAENCSHLFVDEAHHVKAVTWNRLRSRFDGKPRLQFTATPYRNDGKHVDGEIVFNYPLRKAQEEGYFKKIVLKELWDFLEPDQAIAKAAIEQLKADLKSGYDHIVMARCSNIAKAETLNAYYQESGSEFDPVVVHSDLASGELTARMEKVRSRQSRVAICVAMFGEGFDLPELKIAALHDIHQSLAVTIQFTGRFTRSNANVGPATIIVNRADADIDDSVRELYAHGGGADWNRVLTKLTEGATETQIAKENFYQSFAVDSPIVPIQNVTPKMSAVVYRTTKKWTPWKIERLSVAKSLQGKLSVSVKENTAFFVTLTNELANWTDPPAFVNQFYDLYALFWDPETRLLYINSSNNASVHEDIAKAVGGDDAELFKGIDAFRVMHGIKRLLLRNMGLNDRIRRSVRFMMFTGSDIQAYLDSAQTYGKEKTHVFGDGFDGNARVTVGTSKKGRIWSWREAKDLLEWKKWCIEIGRKLTDPNIDPDSFLQESFVPEDLKRPPNLYPLTIEWPDEVWQHTEDAITVYSGKDSIPFFEVGIDLIDPAPQEPLRFRVYTEEISADYELKFVDDTVRYQPQAQDLPIRVGKRPFKLSEFFDANHPIIRYEKDCFSRADQLLRPRIRKDHIFNPTRILTWDWTGVDLKKESQRLSKRVDSIQRRTIEIVSSSNWDRSYRIIFDDDSSGEAADVVCIAVTEDKLNVDLFHCKFSKDKPSDRVKDLYEVCGQAQRSIKWREDSDRLFEHLLNREKRRLTNTKISRFERGSLKELQTLRFEARALVPSFRIFIVQPGLSKEKISDEQRELLSTTDLYLYETLGIEFGVIASLK